MTHTLRRLRHQLADDQGFTLVEAMVSITILAVGAFTVAQAMMFGLETTGLSRQRLASRAALDQQMERARALNYDNLVLSDTSQLTHSTDTANPDYWVSTAGQTYDPDGNGSLSPESIVRVAGASPALEHLQNPYVNGNTTYEVYRYVTWYDSPQDGSGGSDAADGNNNGVSDANGHDAKRVTVVVVWRNNVTGDTSSLSESSMFSDGEITYKAPTKNNAPTVSCPTTSISGLTVTFTGVAADADGSIASYAWSGGGGLTGTGATLSYTYGAAGTYNVVTTVVDNGGSSASNSAAGCTVTVTNPGGLGNGGPNGTISINAGAVRTNTAAVTLTLTKSNGPASDTYKISNDGTTWSAAFTWPNGASTTQAWTLASGADGTRTVYVRYFNVSGQYGDVASDQIALDATAPAPPTAFHKVSSTTTGANTAVVMGWTAPTGVTDLGGYRMYGRLITSTGAWALVCDTSSTSCSHTHNKNDTYEYYVVAYDLSTNVSAQSATPNPTG
jgi:prepilin-type N-terminal cleavage/methylation domain-containing protein